MAYNWNRPLLPGTIVASNFNTFDGEPKVGLFVVLYDEQSDMDNMTDTKNVIAVKLSTQNTLVSSYVVRVNKDRHEFLDNDCIACCGKIHILHKTKQIYKVLGELTPGTYKNVYKMYETFKEAMNKQMMQVL